MDLLKDKIKPTYLKYLSAAFGSALISSIYGVVDMAMVGQYEGPSGTAALAIVAPIWNIIYSLGLLMGIGGSVIFSKLKGESKNNQNKANEYYTSSFIGVAVLAFISWILIVFFDRELLMMFGASEEILPIAREYVAPIKFTIPIFLLNQYLAAFLRNDGSPSLATKAVMFGGVFNIFGDYFCVFTLNMGAYGAGLATAIGSVASFIIMLTHFRSKHNTLKFNKPVNVGNQIKEITVTGFSTFFIDVAMGILTIMFNKQIMKYLGTDALSVYGIIINVSTFVQCCAYSIGQASQPIISTNYGARQGDRIIETLKYALITAIVFGTIWLALCELFPNMFVYIFMSPTESVLNIAPGIIRKYALSFLLLPINIFSTYYFQSLMQPKISFVVSVGRGFVISGILIYLLPVISADSIWLAMPITEIIVLIYVSLMILSSIKNLKELD